MERTTLSVEERLRHNEQIEAERMELEQKRKDINRVFHDLKHELIMLNPRENYAKAATE